MTEVEVIRAMREHLETLFPKECPNCRRHFSTLREYLTLTTHCGSAIPYDAEGGDWQPKVPVGTVTYANCPCGTTLALSSEGLPISRLWPMLNWARLETKKRGMKPRELLTYLRERICKQVFEEPEKPPTP